MEKYQINKIEEIIGHKFSNELILERAFTHASYANQHGLRSYDRLEFFGDSILGFIITEAICKHYLNKDQGQLTVMKKNLVSTRPLSKFIRESGLDKYIIVARATPITDKICEDIFEAIVAAIYLDTNSIEAAKSFVFKYFDESLFKTTETQNFDYKSKALEKYGIARLSFKTLSKHGEDHNPVFTIAAYLDGKEVARAKSSKKLNAEQTCSKKILNLNLD